MHFWTLEYSCFCSLDNVILQYNGCMWKGGKLRLEKAKEHYLVRLKHEWDEDVELAGNLPTQNIDPGENVISSEKSKKDPSMEKVQLRIFFPKLRKVKSFIL